MFMLRLIQRLALVFGASLIFMNMSGFVYVDDLEFYYLIVILMILYPIGTATRGYSSRTTVVMRRKPRHLRLSEIVSLDSDRRRHSRDHQ